MNTNQQASLVKLTAEIVVDTIKFMANQAGVKFSVIAAIILSEGDNPTKTRFNDLMEVAKQNIHQM